MRAGSTAPDKDPEASFALGLSHLWARGRPRDLAKAHQLFERAAAAGHVEAQRLRAILIINGTGCPSDPALGRRLLEKIAASDPYAATQIKFTDFMMSPQAAKERPVELICQSPRIELIRGLLLPEECRYVMIIAEPHLTPSIVLNPATGQNIPHPVRTSDGMSFGPAREDLVIHQINRRIADATGSRVNWGEPLHVLRYMPGQQYRPHVDALPGESNQRRRTALVYLNQDYEGGETAFPKLGISVRGDPGDVLVFDNLGEDGQSDRRSEHAGMPVTAGVKWLATRWIRGASYHPWA